MHTITKDGKDVFYGKKVPLEIRPLREQQMKSREEDMCSIVRELIENDRGKTGLLSSARLPDWVNIDTEKIIVAGHSFGGITAIRSSMIETKYIKACLTFDPWFYLFEKEAFEGKLNINIPFIMVNSDHFDKHCNFDIKGSTKAFFDNSKTMNKECYTFKGLYHE
jgi:hypothetical protein